MFHIVVIVVFLFYSSTKKECLVISTSNPLIDNVKDGFSLHEGSSGNGSKSKHGHSSVVHLSLLGKSELHSRHNSVRLGALGLLVHVSLKRIKQKRIRERQGADGGHKSNHEGMHIGNQDDGTSVGDGILSRDGGKSSPLLKVKGSVKVGDKSMSLGIGGGADEYPSKHSVTSVPLFGLNRGSPSPLGEVGVFSFPISHSLFEITDDD